LKGWQSAARIIFFSYSVEVRKWKNGGQLLGRPLVPLGEGTCNPDYLYSLRTGRVLLGESFF
jgi:hypothetical protein